MAHQEAISKMPFNLVLGIAGPYGAGSTSLAEELSRAINDWPGLSAQIIHAATLIERFYPLVLDQQIDVPASLDKDRRKTLQQAGTALRQHDSQYVGKIISLAIRNIATIC
jgi:uridine kinase